MVELLKSKSMIVVIILVLGVSFASTINETTLDENNTKIQINA